jgi:magnesium chelatase subunit H
VPLEELGRPRIDVVMTLSGIFRDLLPIQTKVLAEAAWLAAEADEPLEMNFVRANALAYAERPAATSRPRRCASSPTPTAPMARTSTSWSTAAPGTTRTSSPTPTRSANASPMAATAPPRPAGAAAEHARQDVDLAYQNLESVELGVTTIDHYFDTLGGIGRAVKRAKGARTRRSISATHPRRGQGPHPHRAGRAGDPHPHAQPQMV